MFAQPWSQEEARSAFKNSMPQIIAGNSFKYTEQRRLMTVYFEK